MTLSGDILTDDYLREAEQRARRFSGAYFGTSGSLAADVIRILKHLRHQQQEIAAMQEATAAAVDAPPEDFVKANERFTLAPAAPQKPFEVKPQPLRQSLSPEALEAAWSAVAARREQVIERIQSGESPEFGVDDEQPIDPTDIDQPEQEAGKVVDGDRTRFATGAVRSSDAEEFRYDLISPIGLEAVARTCAEGAAKYSAHNWERGMDVPDLLNHALRHVFQFLAGDRSEPHLPHAAWGLLAAIHSETLWPHLNKDKLRGPGCTPPYEPPI